MKIKYLLYTALVISLGACSSSGKKIDGIWLAATPQSTVDSSAIAKADTIFVPKTAEGSFLNFESNKCNLRLFSYYAQGKWEMQKDSTIKITTDDKNSLIFKISKLSEDSLSLTLTTVSSDSKSVGEIAQGTTIQLIRNTEQYKKEENPYSRLNNEWALKPSQKMTPFEVKQKVLKYLKYINLVLNDPVDNSSYLNELANPIVIAKNGLGLKDVNEVSLYWKNAFYDQNDFIYAYNMVRAGCCSPLQIPKTTEMVARNTDLIKQISVWVENTAK
jgi:hypothetical protein